MSSSGTAAFSPVATDIFDTEEDYRSYSTSVELLAPAGGQSAFRAALKAGADAIYLGVDKFNARRNAENFQLEDLPEITRQAHLSGVRVYLTMNIILKASELFEALKLAHDAYLAGIDGFIIQDWGLLAEITHAYPELECHISTQANVHDVQGVRFAKDMGAQRVTTSRELSLAELSKLSQQGVEIEAFGHGALCICYSGQCLMSSLIGQRSANRGRCAQPCRLSYTLVNEEGVELSRCEGTHLLSPKDLSTIDILPELVASGVRSIKIEGRMKSAEYVGIVVGTYRKALDRALKDPDNYQAFQEEKDALIEAFSRGFSSAYLKNLRNNSIMSYQRPNNRGIQLARVTAFQQGFVELSLEFGKELRQGDVLEYWTGRGRFAEELTALYDRPDLQAFSYESSALIGSASKSSAHKAPLRKKRVWVRVSRPLVLGDRVFRVRNAKLVQDIDEAVAHAYIRRRPVHMSFVAHKGKPMHLSFADENGQCVEVRGPLVERARTKCISTEEVYEHLSRLGGSPFKLGSLQIELDEGVGMSYSVLHKLRKEASEALEQEILKPWKSRSLRPVRTTLADGLKMKRRPCLPSALSLCVLVRDAASANRALKLGVQLVYMPVQDYARQKDRLADTSKIVVLMDEVSHDKDARRMQSIAQEHERLAFSNVSQLKLAQELNRELEVWNSIPAINESVLAFLERLQVKKLWLSPELSLGELVRLVKLAPFETGVVISGRQQLMVSEHCVLMSMGPCFEQCKQCSRRKVPVFLQDRKSYRFPVYTDDSGRCHIYNSVSLDASPELGELYAAGIRNIMVDASLLSEEEMAEELKYILQQIIRFKEGKPLRARRDNTTAGHLYRGIE